jgi:hypothetical protein
MIFQFYCNNLKADMKVSTKVLFFGTALAVCAFSAQAVNTIVGAPKTIVFDNGIADFNNQFNYSAVGSAFVDSYNFTVPSISDAYGNVNTNAIKSGRITIKDLDITEFTLTGINGFTKSGERGDFSNKDGYEYWMLEAYNLASGNYTLQVSGIIKSVPMSGGVGYSGSLDLIPVVSAVPEPATWAMFVSGLGLVGSFARRRKARECAAGKA